MSILIPILLPLVTACFIQILGRLGLDKARDGLHTIMAAVTFYYVSLLVPDVLSGNAEHLRFHVVEMFPNAPIMFKVEPLGMLFALVASGLWIPTSMYGFGYMRGKDPSINGHDQDSQTRFFTCFAMAISFAIGVAFSGNLLTLFCFYEALTFSTFPLVAHYQDAEAKRSGRIYLGILVSTSVCLLLSGILGVWYLTGQMEFQVGGILQGDLKDDPWTVSFLLALFAFGTAKAALLPFHKWLPNAMVAPTPVSALLHAVAVVKAGVFTVLKVVVYVFGFDLLNATDSNWWLMAVAAATILFSSCVALTKDNLKARLAYSTISQLAYIVLGAAMANPVAAMGAALHILMHAVGKITLFFCAGAIYIVTHKKYISKLDGIGYKMPWTMGAFTIASFSIIGLPPFGGAWSKWFLGLGALEAEGLFYMATFMVSSLLSIGYLMPIVARAYFRKPVDGDLKPLKEPLLLTLPLCLTAVGCIGLFIAPDFFYELLSNVFNTISEVKQ